jgi:asparagine synthase (glutamine-hydrolysing)
MCGICGIVDLGGRPVDRDLVRRMANVIAHRGPDGEGFYFNRGGAAAPRSTAEVALAARRLAIIDVDAGKQPIGNEDGSVWVAYNGEIYNHAQLRIELEARGHSFRTHCDTEVVVHAYEEWGDDCVQRFNGMFAFAIWDDRRRRLVLARDRLGVKPLVYFHRGERLLFGSEIKSILESDDVGREVNGDALVQYLAFFAVPDPQSLFLGVRRLPAGHLLVFDAEGLRVRRYWDIDGSRIEKRSESDWLEELEALLEDSVRMRLISEVPLGAFLSGGIDSGLVVAMMARAGGTVRTCSVEFQPGYSEASFARLVAERFATDHAEYSFGADDVWQTLPEMVWHHDEPSQSLIQTYYVSKVARRHVTVALSGLGGDELFTGYPAHVAAQGFHYFDRVPAALQALLGRLLAAVPGSTAARARRFVEAAAIPPDRLFASRYLQATAAEERDDMLADEWLGSIDREAATEYLLDVFARAKAADFRAKLLYVDQKAYLANELLRTTDSMSMAHSLEVRTPFLDYRLVELASRMPIEMKMRGFTTKYAVRQLARRLLPAEISRRPKSGFSPPIRNWITANAQAFIRDSLAPDVLRRQGYFDPDAVSRMLDEQFSGRRDRSQWVLLLLTLTLWHGLFIERRGRRAEPAAAVAAV